MKFIFLIYISFLCAVTISAQNVSLKKQKGFRYERFSDLDSLNIKDPDFKLIDIEFRVYYNSSAYDTLNHKFIQIVKNKNGLWSGKLYSYYYYNEDSYNFKDVIIEYLSLENWDKTWQIIVEKNYINLPTESDIKQANKPLVLVSGGHHYTIEVLTKKRKRRIYYGNPASKYESCPEYGLNCYEYEHFLQLIQLLDLW